MPSAQSGSAAVPSRTDPHKNLSPDGTYCWGKAAYAVHRKCIHPHSGRLRLPGYFPSAWHGYP